ncbi:MAG: tyrosine-type recombinase/integrase [Chloroflexi bacterium]|nr:tyrosine-type recombinase/integrase [Chloroflexota bacterium]
MYSLKSQDQGLITLSQQDYLPLMVESFLIDRRSQSLSPDTIELYTKKLQYFLKYCERQALTQISQLTSDFIRRYLLELSETHNAGGVHACFRPLRTMLYWLEEEEVMPPDWKNPIRRVKAPKLPTDPIEPIQIEEIHQLLKTCQGNYSGVRDKAMMLGLLDTGARAKEFLNINLEDVDLATGAVMIRQGKGRKPRMVFLGRKTIRAIRGYLRYRKDNSPALWVSIHGERMTYSALRCFLRRRAEQIGLKSIPTPHDFRRAFALVMLRNGVDIFALQKLMGHSDLQILRRYLAQTDQDIHNAHMRGSPVDSNL